MELTWQTDRAPTQPTAVFIHGYDWAGQQVLVADHPVEELRPVLVLLDLLAHNGGIGSRTTPELTRRDKHQQPRAAHDPERLADLVVADRTVRTEGDDDHVGQRPRGLERWARGLRRDRAMSRPVLIAILFAAVATRAGAQGVQLPPKGPAPTPRHTGIKAMTRGLWTDVTNLPSVQNRLAA